MLTEEQRTRLAELLALPADQLTPELIAERDQLLGQSTAEDMAAVTQIAVAAGSAAADTTDTSSTDTTDAQPAQLAAGRGPAQVPGSLAPSSGTQTRARNRPIRELYAAQARVLSGVSRPQLEAALADITMTSNIWTMRDAYAGELWSGLEYQRRFVANSMPGELDGIKGTGWRWVVKPQVADYAGDKAAVPSNTPETEDTEWNAARLAGAHDIDRAHFDFGNTAFIESYYQAMRESYAVQSDYKALAFQLAKAVALAGDTTSLFRAVAEASQAVEDNTLGQAVDFVYVNSADRLDLIDVLDSGIPAYLELFGITPETFRAAPGVTAGSVVVGTRQATKFRELGETPIRVEAIHMDKGGVDGGVFGYYATEEIFPGGIVKKTWA